jgi:hypothetical protein
MDFRNPAECLQLLQRLQPANVDEAHATLYVIVGSLLDAAPPPNQHLEVLEAARPLLGTAQAAVASRYAACPLPPDAADNETLERVVTLWQELARSYALIALRDAAHGTLEDQRALLAQRRIHYAGMALIESYRAHRAVPAGRWAEVHEGYAAAVQAGVERVRVADPLNEVWKAQSPLEAYAAILLVELGNPYGRDQRELAWVCRWAQRFAPYCKLDGDVDKHKPHSYGLDPTDDAGLRPMGLLPRTAGLLRFDGSQLGGQIQAVLARLKAGGKPAALSLGEDCPTEAVARLLLSLYRPWGLAAAGRRFPRRPAGGELELSGNWQAIGLHIEGKVFEQPRIYHAGGSLTSDLTLLTFGERVADADDSQLVRAARRKLAERLGLECGRWQLADQSVGGFRVQRRAAGERLEYHQLVGVRPPDGSRFLLGCVCWLMQRADGVLEAGVHVLTGVPSVIAARLLDLRGDQQPWQQAFMLPATPALKTGPSLVLPGRDYRPNRIVELHDGECPRQVRLTELLLRGANFDQAGFEVV